MKARMTAKTAITHDITMAAIPPGGTPPGFTGESAMTYKILQFYTVWIFRKTAHAL